MKWSVTGIHANIIIVSGILDALQILVFICKYLALVLCLNSHITGTDVHHATRIHLPFFPSLFHSHVWSCATMSALGG